MQKIESRITLQNPESEKHYQTTLQHEDILWKLYLAPKSSSANSSKVNSQQYFNTVNHINWLAINSPDMIGTCPEHDQTLGFISQRWSEVLNIINKSRTEINTPFYEPIAFPEVKLTYPIFDGSAGHSLDFVGFDELGDIYVIEVGSGHKSAQLEKQLFLARTIFPEHAVHGLIAKYTKQTDSTYRLYFRYH